MRRLQYRNLALLACAIGLFAITNAHAAQYPNRAVNFVVGSAPGGGTDLLTRVLAQKLTAKWGEPVVVQNRPGASNTISADLVAHAAPDGYTIILVTTNHTIVGEFKLNYDPIKDFAPIIEVATQQYILGVNPSLPVHSLAELITYAKARPGQLNMGSGGTYSPSFLPMAIFMDRTGTKFTNVNFASGGPTLVALLSGEIQLMFASVTTLQGNIKGGKVRGLAISGDTPSPLLPEIPTFGQTANLKGFDGSAWFGVLAPAGTPRDIVTKINADISAAMQMPDVKKTFSEQGFVAVGGSPEQLGAFMQKDLAGWSAILKKLDIKG